MLPLYQAGNQQSPEAYLPAGWLLLQELHWCDLRDATFQQLDLDACLGLILNVQVGCCLLRCAGSHGGGKCRCFSLL